MYDPYRNTELCRAMVRAQLTPQPAKEVMQDRRNISSNSEPDIAPRTEVYPKPDRRWPSVRIYPVSRHMSETRAMTIRRIIRTYFDISEATLIGSTQERRYIKPRFIACLLMQELTGASYPEIGRKMGARDHTTIMNAIRKARLHCRHETEYADDVEACRRLCLEQFKDGGSQ